jgi:TolB-like protein
VSDPFAQTLYAPRSPSDTRDGPSAPRASGAGPTPSIDAPVSSGVTPSEVPPTGPAVSETRARLLAGRYEIVGLLGAGGMGNVYRARDLELGEVVALKMLRPEIVTNPAALDRFRLEVKLARRVTHPNVARVFDIGEDGGERYLTMELVDGEPLGAVIRREGRLAPARSAAIARGVCEALAAAHAAGVVHRDLKPDNVMLARDGRAVVTDFGIAQAAGVDQVRVTASIVGTPAYMAPEQVEGKTAGAPADLYALGVMLFEMVTGELPWTGDSVFAVAAARVLSSPPDPIARQPHLPADLAAVIRKLMARAPEDRYARAEDARAALAEVPAAVVMAPAPTIDLARPVLCKCKKQIAVLPLRNAGPKEDAYIADGLTEDLIDQLSTASEVRVRSRGMVARYCCGDRDPREIGRELDVQVVVDGTVRRTPAGVRVTVRLISVADGVQIWHRRFDRKPEDILSVSDEAALAIADALAVQLEAPERGATSPEAIELYLRARALYVRFFDDTGEAIQLLERACALAPDDPRILAAYAMAMARRWARDPSAASTAREAAQAAAARAPNLAESHVALAVVRYQERREPEAVRALKRALLVSPTNAEAHDMLGRILAETRLLAEAQGHLVAALMAEPDMHLSRMLLTRTHLLRGAADEARAMVLTNDHDSPAYLPAIARYCLWRRDADMARATLERPITRGNEWRLAKLMLALVADGTLPWDDFAMLQGKTNRFTGFIRQLVAECAMYSGDHERALDAVEGACAEEIFDLAWMDLCPLFEPLREHPRFRASRAAVEARAAVIEAAYREPTAHPRRH